MNKRNPTTKLVGISSHMPSVMWGINIIGTFLPATIHIIELVLYEF